MALSSRIILITGAGSGIGRALAVCFAADGYTVYGIGRTKAALEQTKAQVPSGNFQYFQVDITNYDAIKDTIEAIKKRHGSVDAVINNAAIYPKKNFLQMSPQEWDSVINTNLNAVAHICHLVLPDMLKNHYGRIINIGSLADKAPIKGAAAYSVSKGGLHVLTRAIAQEIDPERYPDILINEFLPPATRTAMSNEGADPKQVYLTIKALIERAPGSDTGRSYTADREILPNIGLKALLFHGFKEKLTRALKK